MDILHRFEHLLTLMRDDLDRRCKAEMERFGRALQRWFDTVLPRLAPEKIEPELYRFLAVWDGEGVHVSPESYLNLLARLQERARFVQFAESTSAAPPSPPPTEDYPVAAAPRTELAMRFAEEEAGMTPAAETEAHRRVSEARSTAFRRD